MKNTLLTLFLFSTFHLLAQKKLTVHADKIVTPVSPTMWGIFFEDINFAADGGLYAELVKNRSFEFPMPMMGWKEIKKGGEGKLLIVNLEKGKPQNPRYANIRINASNNYGISNEGFRGMGIKAEVYNFSVLARKTEGDVQMTIELLSTSGKKLASATLNNLTNHWKEHKLSFTSNDTASKGSLTILFSGKGVVDIDAVSLFPQKTWKNRPKGLRHDLVQLLADMKPGFLRFPGGCIVEGRDLANRYQWKETVGPVNERKTMVNRWNMEFRHKPAPDYYQSFGLGFFEYFQLAEDLGAEPLPILNCGMACQFNSGEVVAINELDPYIQDALHLIEFANGSAKTKWGKQRADMGHPAPFNLKILGIGNENWDSQYLERLKLFTEAIKKKYPNIKLVTSSGTDPEFKPFSQEGFDYLDKELRKMNVDIIDEHYYRGTEWFLKNADRYDNYDRKGPKIFAGEYAAQSKSSVSTENRNTLLCALSEAAFMTGLERNADIVTMASYAPLFAHVDAWQWTPDLIWFDNLRSYGTPNYYVQKLFAVNKGTHVIPVLDGGVALTGQDSLYASAVLDKKTKQIIIKIANASSSSAAFSLDIQGVKMQKGEAKMEVLESDNKLAVNSLDDPTTITPVEQNISIKDGAISIQPLSFNVIKIPVQ